MLNGKCIEDPRSAVLSELGLPPSAFIMVRTKTQKLSVEAASRQPVEHYDLNQDPCELHNLVGDPDYDSTRSEIVNEVMKPMLKTLDTTARPPDFAELVDPYSKIPRRSP